MKRPWMLPLAAALLPGAAAAAVCGGFPWTVTASSAGGASVAVTICGTYTGCHPHDPSVFVSGPEIRITLTQAELPDCACIAVVGDFEERVVVPPVPPGDYTVIVSILSCGQTIEAGRTTYSLGQAATIPALDARGVAALILLIAGAGLWRLRS